ncbi:MAG: choline dehydrogenase, partial [Alphaproteobacteria bacterium]|nr:choline dehydrogenase [Alphaproteobacteria bacterium]
LATQTDCDTMTGALKLARKIFEQPAIAPYIECETIPGAERASEDELLDYCRVNGATVYHPIGTCKMGDDPMAVVDSSLRLRGLGGLRVVDASVMPRMVSANTNAAVLMIAEKAADMIKDAA